MHIRAIIPDHSIEHGLRLVGEKTIQSLLEGGIVITDTHTHPHLPRDLKCVMCIVIHQPLENLLFGWYSYLMEMMYVFFVSSLANDRNTIITPSGEEAFNMAIDVAHKTDTDIFFFGDKAFLESHAHLLEDIYVIDQLEPHPGERRKDHFQVVPFLWYGAWAVREMTHGSEHPPLGGDFATRGIHFGRVPHGRINEEGFNGRGLVLKTRANSS